MMSRVVVTLEAIDADAELASFARGREGAGAMASFVGYCRAHNETHEVKGLELQHYPGFTEREIEAMAGRVAERCNLIDLLVIHRTGSIAPAEPIVLVAALAGHRAGAFAAVEEIMDYLKTDAPFWKREVTGGGAHWIEPTADDRRRRARWSNE